jgi:hypothetical protein
MSEPITLEQLRDLVKPIADARDLELDIDDLDLEIIRAVEAFHGIHP